MARKKGPRIDRRTFLKGCGGGGAGLVAPSASVTKAGEAFSALAVPPAASRADRVVYRGEQLRAVAMPLGGIGAGAIALAGDGGLRQWQVVHNVDHVAHAPGSFFAFWGKQAGGEAAARGLQSSALFDQNRFKPPLTPNDHPVPSQSREFVEDPPGVKEIEYAGE